MVEKDEKLTVEGNLFAKRDEVIFDWTFGGDERGRMGLILDINNVTYCRIPKPQADYIKSKGYKPNHQPTRLYITEDDEGMHCHFILVKEKKEETKS